MDSKSKGKSVAKPFSSQPAKVKGLSQYVKELRQPKSELSAIILEIKNKLLKQQQEEKAKVSPVENQEWEEEDELILREAGILKDPSIPADFIDLLIKDANIPEITSFEQESMTVRSVDIDKESLQKIIQQYKQQMKYMKDVNDGLMMVNRGLIEELQDVNNHFQELTEVSKEVLKRKRTTDMHCTELEKTVKNLQQENKKLTKRITNLEQEKKKAKRKTQALDGIALLAEAAKEL